MRLQGCGAVPYVDAAATRGSQARFITDREQSDQVRKLPGRDCAWARLGWYRVRGD